MSKTSAAWTPLRLCAALLLFCYSLVSMILPLQHTDLFSHELEGMPTAMVRPADAPAAPLHTQMVAKVVKPLKHCLACEWQSAQVSAALPSLRLKFVLPPAPRVVTTLPRYLSVRVLSTPSRAPPAV